jgi:O-antigen/teichoic acid export membrane protein
MASMVPVGDPAVSAVSPATATGPPGATPREVSVDRLLPLGAAISQLVTFGVIIVLARVLDATAVGLYIQAYAGLAMLSAVCLAGLRSGLSSAVALRRSSGDEAGLRGTIAVGLGLPTAVAVVCSGLIFGLAPTLLRALSMDAQLVTPLRLSAVALIFHVFTDSALAATRGFGTTRYFALVSLIAEPLLRVVLTAGLLWTGAGIRGAMVALVASSAIAAIAAALVLRRLHSPVAARRRYDRQQLNLAGVSWLGALATTGLLWGDVLLLGALRGSDEAGVYAVATRLVALAAMGLPPILAASTSGFAHAVSGGHRAELQWRYTTITGWMARLALPGLVALIVFPRDLLTLFGPGFATAATAAVILACGKLVDAATGPTALVLTLSGRGQVNVLDNVAALLLNVGLNLYLIPRHGIVGAALAWAASIWLLDIARGVQVWFVTGVVPFNLGVLRALVAGNAAMLAALIVSQLLTAPWRLPVGLLDVVVTYLVVTAALGFSSEETRGLSRLRTQVLLPTARA